MKILIFGPQGCGKGTQAKIISKRLKIPHISTGDIFRSLTGDLKERVDALIDNGNLVPDELTLEIVKERISQEDCKNGFILDGFPRNLNQAKNLKSMTEIDKVLEISIPDGESIRRISGRRVCPACKAVFNVSAAPEPRVDGICDFCETKLEIRKDDGENYIKKRLETYHKETEPVLEFYKEKASKIDGMGTIEEISNRISLVI